MPIVPLRLSSRQHPVVRAFRELAGDAGARAGVLDVMLDGAHLVREALAAGVRLRTVLVSTEFLGHASPADRATATAAARSGASVYECTPSVLAAASPVRTPSGIVAIAEWAPATIEATFTPAPAMAMGMVDVQDPGNVGAAIRSAHGLGATGVLALDSTANPAGWKALRGAMGSTFRLPVAQSASAIALAAARSAGLRILATVAEDAQPLAETDLVPPTLVLLGNEGAGLPPEVAAAADARVTIPMRAGTNSLNVAVTAALILYEARRQRTGV